jgi:PAS domain S-box-containing protein
VDFPSETWRREVALARLAPLTLALLAALLLLLGLVSREEARRYHRLLAASETRYRALFERSGDGMFLMGEAFLDCNEEVLRMWRCEREQVLGRGPWDFSPPFQPDGRDSRTAALEHVRSALRGEPRRFDWTHRRADGSTYEAEVLLNRVMVDGRPLVLASVRDVSAQRHLMQALEESERRLARAQRAAQVGSWELDLSKREVRGSDEAFRIWGLSPGDQPLPFYRVQSLIAPEDRVRVDRSLEELLRDGKPYDLVYRLRRVGDATLRIVRAVAEVESGQDGKPARVLGAIQDVTENARVEERLRQAEKMESIGKLAGGIAHDFNNMLTPILGYAEVAMLKVPSGGPGHEELTRIAEAAARASELTRQVLAFSRRQLLDLKALDLNSVLSRMEPLLRRLVGEGVRFDLHLTRGLGEIKADPTQLEQAILNLVVNARDAMPQGGSLVLETGNADVDDAYARKHPGAQPGRFVLLAVTDTGLGMDLATQRHLFEPFFTTKEAAHGAGLGLATAYGIVRQHGGFITVSSEPGHGSTFRIFLPRSAQAAAGPAPEPGTATARGNETVLVVEDEVLVRQLAVSLLVNRGYRVLEAADGHQALEVAAKHPEPIDLLITDLIMPRLNGRDLAAKLAETRPALRVLYMSGHAHDLLGPQAGLAANTHFIQKPFRLEQFERTVREILDRPA